MLRGLKVAGTLMAGLAAGLVFGTTALAERRVDGVGTLTARDFTEQLVHSAVVFDVSAAEEIEWSGEGLTRYPTWAVTALAEWDSRKELGYGSAAIKILQDQMDELLYPGESTYNGYLTAPAYTYGKLLDAGLTQLPTPVATRKSVNVMQPMDWKSFGSRVPRGSVTPGMCVEWRKYTRPRCYSQGGDELGFHMIHTKTGSWLIQNQRRGGLTLKRVLNSPDIYAGHTTTEAIELPKSNPLGAAFAGFTAGDTLTVPGGGHAIWSVAQLDAGEITIWRITPKGWNPNTEKPLDRQQPAFYLVTADKSVVPHVLVEALRNGKGDLLDATLRITGVSSTADEIANGSKRIDLLTISSVETVAAGDALATLPGVLPENLSKGLAFANGTLSATESLSSDRTLLAQFKDEATGNTRFVYVAPGPSEVPVPALRLEEVEQGSVANTGTDEALLAYGAMPSEVDLGMDGYAMDFGGMQETLRIDHAMGGFNDGMTLGFWFRSEPMEPGKQIIFNATETNGRIKLRAELSKDEGMPSFLKTTLVGATSATDTPRVMIRGSYDDNTWHHYAISITTSPSPRTRIYVDGILKSDTPWGQELDRGYTADLHFGNRPNGPESDRFKGQLDSIRLFKSSLDERWIQRLFMADPKRDERAVFTRPTFKTATPNVKPGSLFIVGELPLLKQAGQKLSATSSHHAFVVDPKMQLIQTAPLTEDLATFSITVSGSHGQTLATLPVEIRVENRPLLKAAPWFTDAFRTWDKRLDWSSSNKIPLEQPAGVWANPHIAWLKNTAQCAASGTFARKFGGYCNEFVYTLMYEAGVNDQPLYYGGSKNRISCSPPYNTVRSGVYAPHARNYAVWGEDVSENPLPGDVIAMVHMSGPNNKKATLGTFHSTFFSHKSKDGQYTWTLGGNQSAWTQFKAYPTAPMASTFVRRSADMEERATVGSINGTLHYFWNPGDEIVIEEAGEWEIQPIDLTDDNLMKNIDYPAYDLKNTFYRVVPAGTPLHGAAPESSRVHYIMKEYPHERAPILSTLSGGRLEIH